MFRQQRKHLLLQVSEGLLTDDTPSKLQKEKLAPASFNVQVSHVMVNSHVCS